MALISEAEALRIVGGKIYEFRDVMFTAWDDYLSYTPAQRRLHCSTTRAGIVHDHIKARARECFDDRTSHVIEINRLFVVVIQNRLVVRFKLFNVGKMSRNIRTGQIEDYRMQRDIPELREQLELFGELNHLEAGYILDRLESEICETWLTCPSGFRANAWTHEIRSRAATVGPPSTSIAPLVPSTTTIVRPKESTIATIKRTDKGEETL